jgi:hypothetical protein
MGSLASFDWLGAAASFINTLANSGQNSSVNPRIAQLDGSGGKIEIFAANVPRHIDKPYAAVTLRERIKSVEPRTKHWALHKSLRKSDEPFGNLGTRHLTPNVIWMVKASLSL